MRPLDDLLVLDLSRVLSGPYCTMALADMGARVIKVEQPGKGDETRHFGPPFIEGESTYFLSVNRGKESVTLNLKDEADRAVIDGLLAKADILVENFRPGVAERLGLGYEACKAANPRLVYCSISGFGHAGLPEWSARPGYDIVMQGMGGLQGLTGAPDGAPMKVGTSIADLVTGMLATQGILLALIARGRTGRGQRVDISMLDGQVGLLTYHAGAYFAEGKIPARLGNAHPSIVPYQTFKAKDGYLNLGVANERLWAAFLKVIERPDLGEDPRFKTNAARVANREVLLELLGDLMLQWTVAEWVSALAAKGIPCGPIQTVDQVLNHPQVLARDMVVELSHPKAGDIRVTGVPIKLSETPGAVLSPPPVLGEHSEAIRREFGPRADD